MISKYIGGKSLIVFLTVLLFSGVGNKVSAQSQQVIDEAMLNGVLSGMGSEADIEAVFAAMEATSSKNNYATEKITSVKRPSTGQQSIAGVLDFMDNAYSSYQGISEIAGAFGSQNYNHGQLMQLPGGAVLPILGRVTSRFGYRPSFGRMHKGIDIALKTGDPVVAVMDGTVERVSVDPQGYGLFVCVRHPNGLETRYAHLSRTLVTAGMSVSAGQPVGLGGSTGNSTGPHLHFETRVNGEAVDPSTMFDFDTPANRIYQRRSLSDLDLMASDSPQLPASSVNTYGSDMPKRGTYVVKVGDTIQGVAMKNGISVMTLCRLNMLSTTEALQPGRMLKLR